VSPSSQASPGRSALPATASGSSAAPSAAPLTAPVETVTTLTVVPDRGWVGTTYTFKASVEPIPDGGSVTWLEDGVAVGTTDVAANGTAPFSWAPSDAGSHAWSAAFSGDDGFGVSTSTSIHVDVAPPVATAITLTTSAPRDDAGVSVTVTARLDPLPPDSVIDWTQDGTDLGSTPVGRDGTASIAVTLPSGTTVVTAAYAGAIGSVGCSASVSLVGVPPPDPVCAGPLAWAEARGITSADIRVGHLSFLGASATVTPAKFDPRTPPVSDPTWALWYRALYWLVPVAVEAYRHGDPADVALVQAYVDRYSVDPDPGSATAGALALAFKVGWDEGTNLRREMVLNCLARITPSPTVSSLLEATIVANLDANRYYGLPQRHPHNHGAMANMTLMDTGDVLSRPTLIDAAQTRVLRDVSAVADRCGMTFEQSAGYQSFNASLWPQVSAALKRHGRTAAAATVDAAISRLSSALGQLFRPDGQLEVIGDGVPITTLEHGPPTAPLRMICTATGWVAARTSWLPTASFYTLRFGPGRYAHGHADHGSVTWTRAGLPILEDVGGTTALSAAARAFVASNDAHNVLGVTGVSLSSATSLIRSSTTRYRDLYVVRDSLSGITRTRSVRIAPDLPLLVVLDRASATTTRTFVQRWHFDARFRWDSARARLTDDRAVTGVVTLDLRSRLPATTSRSTTSVMVAAGTGTQQVLSTSRRGTQVALFSVVYVSPTGVKPVLRWYPGTRAGTGRVRIWWGRVYRDVLIDATGIAS
jgi:hypothetical protein